MVNKDSYLRTAREAAQDQGIEVKILDCADVEGHLSFRANGAGRELERLSRELSRTFNQEVSVLEPNPRERAAGIGGIGPCGMTLCCKQWLREPLSPEEGAPTTAWGEVTPQKTGACGKALCCLCYESGFLHCQGPVDQKPEDIKAEPKPETTAVTTTKEKEKPKEKSKKRVRRLKIG